MGQLEMQRPYSVVLEATGNNTRAIAMCSLARQLLNFDISAAVKLTDAVDLAFAQAYGVPLTDDSSLCEVLVRAHSAPWPARPTTPYVVDYVFFPSDASGDADAVIAQFTQEPPVAIGDNVVVQPFLQPIPPEVYDAQRFRTNKHCVVCLGLDPLNRTAGLVSIIAGSGHTASGVVLPGSAATGSGFVVRHDVWEELRFADVAVCESGAMHQIAVAMGIPVVAVASTAITASRSAHAARTVVNDYFQYAGDLNVITNADVRDLARSLMDDDDLTSAKPAGIRGIQIGMGHSGRVDRSRINTSRIARWVAHYLVGTTSTPFLLPGYDTLVPGFNGKILPDRRPLPVPVMHWKMEELSGTRRCVGMDHDLFEMGEIVPGVPAKINRGASFVTDASGNQLMTSLTDIFPATSWTATFWVKLGPAHGIAEVVLSEGDTSTAGGRWRVVVPVARGDFRLTVSDGAVASNAIVTMSVLDETWYLVAVRHTVPNGWELAVWNGSTWSKATTTRAPNSVPVHFSVGAATNGSGRLLDAVVDEVKVWDRLVDDAFVAAEQRVE